jgi:hypothetical protein
VVQQPEFHAIKTKVSKASLVTFSTHDPHRNVKSKYHECIQEKLTMVILFLLLGVSAKHFIEEVSTTVSQNVTTGSATCIPTRQQIKSI